MKNKLSLLSMGVVALFVASCSDDDLGSSSLRSANAILTATVEGYASNTPSTRAGFSKPTDDTNSYPFYWSKGDVIGVTSISNESESLAFSSLKLADADAGGTTGSFSSDEFSGTVGNYAVYPNHLNHSITFDSSSKSGATLTYYLRNEYEYTKVDQGYFESTEKPTGTTQSWNPAMFAKIEDGKASFTHLGGVICVKFPSMPATEGYFLLRERSSKAITGSFTTNISSYTTAEAGNVSINTVDISTDNSGNYGGEVYIKFSGAELGEAGVFYVPVPVGTYEFSIVLLDSNKNTDSPLASSYAGNVVVNRRTLYGIQLSSANIVGSGSVKTLDSTTGVTDSDINSALSNDVVVVDAAVTNPKIEIPATTSSSSSDTETSKTVILNQVNSGSTITLSDGNTSTTDASKSVDNVTVSLPTSATATGSETTVTAPSLEVTLPNTTVTVEANTGSTTIETATVETADNTFIVGSGVTINTLNVKKGNVILKSGSKVKAIAAKGNSNIVNVYYESDSSCPTSFADGNNVYYAKRAGLTELKKAAEAGGDLKLTENVTLDESLDISAALELNLNGYNLTVPTGKVLTISSSSVSKITLGEKSVLDVADNNGVAITGKAEIVGGTIKGTSPISIAEGGELKLDGTTVSDLSLLTSTSVLGALKGSVVLADDLTVSTLSVSGNKALVVDLNKKTLTMTQTVRSYINLDVATDAIVYKNGNITLGDGNGNDAAISMTKGTFKLDGVILDASKWHTAIKGQNSDTYVEITNISTVKGHYFTLSTNASTKGESLVDGCDANITLENSTFEADETGFMNNVPATIKMTNCTFSGNHQGALLRGGTYTITGCTFTLKAELTLDHKECHNNSTWESGNKTAYAAIVIGNRSDSAYRYTTTVTFVGDDNKGEVSGTNVSSFPAAYAWGVSGDAYKVTITGNMAGFRNSANYDFVYGGNVDVSGATNLGNSQQASGTNGGENVYVTGNY